MAESETEKAFSSNPLKGKQTVKRLKNVARNVPVLGTAFDVADIASSVATGNLGQAAVDTGLALAGTTPVGRVLSKTIKKSLNKARSKFKDKFKIDNPDDIYDPTDKKIKSYGQMYADEVKKDTEEKIKKKELKPEQLEDYVNTHGNLYKITGFIKGQESIPFHPLELINAKGVKGEHKYRDNSPQLFNLKERIKKEGYKPDPIHVIIDERGRPFVMEGNHRLAEAIQSGRNRIDVELQYLRGGENVDGPFSPKNLGLKSEMAKGGAMLNQQMKMAFMSEGGSFPDLTGDGKVTKKDILRGRGIEGFQEGGLRDEGGTVDPVSGNDVPSGSTKSEVRDDIPAMLSEGEFVFPADVVRYIGLSKLMEMRQEAKMGLKIMEEMGQMGNSEEATLPDDFGIPDIEIIEDDEELDGMDDDDDENDMDNMTESGRMMTMEKRAQGGVIEAQQGTAVPPQQTQFEQMMGYGAGQGSTRYNANRVPYTKADGTIVNVLEDYMGRPMQDVEGLTRVTPYEAGPIFGGGVQPVQPIQPVLPPMPDDPTDNTAAKKDKDAFYGKGSDSTGRLTSMAEARKQGKKLGDFSDAYDAQQERLNDPTRTGNLLEDLKIAGKDLAGRPERFKTDFKNLIESLPEDLKNTTKNIVDAVTNKKNSNKKSSRTLSASERRAAKKSKELKKTDYKDKKSIDAKKAETTKKAKESGFSADDKYGALKKGGLMKKDYP